MDEQLIETVLHYLLGATLGSTALFCATWLTVTLIRRRDHVRESAELRDRLHRLEDATDHVVGRLVEMEQAQLPRLRPWTPVPEARGTPSHRTPH